jgi:cystathionine beta-lyase/cystathionine gamma-synthase
MAHPLTLCVHAGQTPEPVTGAIMQPIFQTSTYVQEAPGEHKGYDYSRGTNPTRTAYEKALAELEGAAFALSFSSGLAAEQAIAQTLKPGDRVLVCDDVYGGTGRLFRKLYAKYGIEFYFVDMTQDIPGHHPACQMIWVETPSNPTMKVISIEKMAALAKKWQALLVVDNTFASPIFQSPLALGADVVIHSTTKYIGGHSDVIGGALMTSNPTLYEELKFIQFAAGAVHGPFECFLLLRSIKTLGIRMAQHQKNAFLVADFLATHPKVKKIYFPGLKTDPGHGVAMGQMTGFSGMISFDWNGPYSQVVALTQHLKLFSLAESLGGIESLINHPEKMTHASVPPDLRQKLGIGPSLLRLSVGIEEGSDLVADLKDAFDFAGSH